MNLLFRLRAIESVLRIDGSGAPMSDRIDCSDFFSTLDTTLTRKQIARLYEAIGWQVRKCAWKDYEIVNDWAELVIEGEKPILMHGWAFDLIARVEELVTPLRVAGVSFTAECYGSGPERELLLELRS